MKTNSNDSHKELMMPCMSKHSKDTYREAWGGSTYRIHEKAKASVVSLHLIKRGNGHNYGTFMGKNIVEHRKEYGSHILS